MHANNNDPPASSQKNPLPKDSVSQNYLENGNAGNPELDGIRLQHEKDTHDREKQLFSYVKTAIMLLFIFSGFLISGIFFAIVCCDASPWLISLGTVSLIIPTVLLGCFLHHIYGQDNTKKPLAEFFAKTPLNDILAWVKEIVAAWRSS